MPRRTIAASFLIVAVGAIASFYGISRASNKPAAEKERIVHAERRKIGAVVNATGVVRLRVGSEVRVGSQLSGIVKKLNVTVGSHVEEGEVIAEIDNRMIEAQIADSAAQAELDRASMERTRVSYERARVLASKKVIAAQEEEDLRLALGEAKARYEKSLRACDLVKVNLNYINIRAPIHGTVASVSTQKGETVAAAFTAPTFVTIIADHALQLVAMVDENDIATVQTTNPVTFTVDAFPARDLPGAVESIAPKATIVSGVVNYEVTIAIEQGAELLKPDMTANVSIHTAQHDALLLPGAAVQHEGDQTFVYVAAKSGRERKAVAVGPKENGMVEIKKGIGPDDAVVVPGTGGA
ncbi:MAG TPA: efflux RND transporter periplasmic adaptor subunit [Chthoniobacterales bacterium]|jgi:RND family efflux transporter MFP subunit|nr:efflux RND transporter periplasmic adaptor subunit [Chthoniobacterales bacterium]